MQTGHFGRREGFKPGDEAPSVAPMTPLFDLSGRRALITGSTRGIGFALARGLAAHGAEVILNGRDSSRLAQACETLSATGQPFDVTDENAVRDGVSAVEQDGPIDILVNNAGMQYRAPLEEYPTEIWEKILRTNVTSAFLMARAVAPAMIARKSGKIINIASIQSELARPSIAPYTATKGAIRNLTRGMATDWARHGLQVNAIAPGYFKTPLNQALIDDPDFTAWLEGRTPAGRWGDIDELVGLAVLLAGPGSSFINGQTIYVDGGMSASV